MTTHLAGRMPHSEIDALFQLAPGCKSQADREQLDRKLKHVSAVVAQLLREFRASLPANAPLLLPAPPARSRMRCWR